MRLTLVSLVMAVYVAARLLPPLPFRWPVKAGLALLLALAGGKFFFYQWVTGAFFSLYGMPRSAVLALEALYAALLLLFLLTLLRDVVAVALWLARCFGLPWRLPLSAAAQAAGLTALALVLAVTGVWEAVRVPRARTVEVTLPNLPESLDGLRLVQLSDLHVGPLQKRDWLQAVVERANSLNPDVVVLTGDIMDGSPSQVGDAVVPLADLHAPYGVYGVTGNHEYYSGVSAWLPILRGLGVDMLNNEHRLIAVRGETLVIAGVPDPADRRFGGRGPEPAVALEGAPDRAAGATRVLLAHQPGAAAACAHAADLQLSGHTHGGLLIGLRALVAAYNGGFVGGLYNVDGMQLYVHPGTGLWNGFTCRVGVFSEVTCLVLRRPE